MPVQKVYQCMLNSMPLNFELQGRKVLMKFINECKLFISTDELVCVT